MTVKILSDKRGPLQGVSVEAVVRNAYGPGARYVESAEGGGEILGADGTSLDTVIELHETDG